MPKTSKPTRHATLPQKENIKAQPDDQVERMTTNTATNSKPDPLVQDYKLHFELTDLESTKPTVDDGERPSAFEQGQGGPPSPPVDEKNTYPTPAQHPHDKDQPDPDHDGEGEPDFAYDAAGVDASYDPALIDDRHLARSTHQSDQYNSRPDHFDGSSTFIVPHHPEHSGESGYHLLH
jgi:hypothetical protein